MERIDLCDAPAWIGEFAGRRTEADGARRAGSEAHKREEVKNQQEMDDQQGIAEYGTSALSVVVAG